MRPGLGDRVDDYEPAFANAAGETDKFLATPEVRPRFVLVIWYVFTSFIDYAQDYFVRKVIDSAGCFNRGCGWH